METIAALELQASLADLEEIRQFITQTCAPMHISADAVYNFNLAVTELVTNTILYGYKEQPGRIAIEILRQEGDLLVRISDAAPFFDPTQAPPPDFSTPIEERPPGGWGIYLTRQIVDRFTHRKLTDGGNEVTLVIEDIIPFTKEEKKDGDQD
jgi:anti-sigma regulatory factor (Ser/Thr protein kinase)